MTRISTNLTPGQRLLNWARVNAERRAGNLLFLLALLFLFVSIALQGTFDFPNILLDTPSMVNELVAHNRGMIALSFLGLFLCGTLQVSIALGLMPRVSSNRRKAALLTGGTAGLFWVMSSLLGLALIWVGDRITATSLSILTLTLFMLAELAAPMLLAVWTVIILRQFPIARIAGIGGVLGLLLTCLRSIFWSLEALLLDGSGFSLTAGMVVNVLAVIGIALWLFWQIRLSLWLISQGRMGEQPRTSIKKRERRSLLTAGARLGVGLLGGTFVLTRTGLLAASAPPRESDDIPAIPSLAASLFYLAALTVTRLFPALTSNTQAQNADPQMQKRRVALPVGTSLEEVDALGVPAELICAPGSDRSSAVLYLHGGGWQERLHDSQRLLASQLSAATGVCVLVPDYRVAPLHPFPAALQDCVSAYRWLRSQGIAAERIVMFGDSVGGNFVLTASLLLRDSGEALPAALVSLYPGTDLTQSGETWYTKDNVSIIVRRESGKREIAAWVGGHDLRNPLISPLFADVKGLPPTLLQVGTQEVLLSDSIRMADHLRRASVQTKLEIWPGMWHAWHFEYDMVPEARLAIEHIVKFIRSHLMKRQGSGIIPSERQPQSP